MILCMQYWDGDRDRAMETSRLIADMELQKQDRHQFLFAYRFDAQLPDPETVRHVSEKFNVMKPHKGRRREVGWPAGCNGLACDILMLAAEKHREREWKTDAVWLIESDIVPLKRDWLDLIDAEWKQALAQNKLVMGAWQKEWGINGHVNGNLVFHPTLCLKVAGLEGSAPQMGWDVYLAEKFRPHWWKSSQMANFYRHVDVKMEQLFLPREPLAFVHGIKDDSGRRLVREKHGLGKV